MCEGRYKNTFRLINWSISSLFVVSDSTEMKTACPAAIALLLLVIFVCQPGSSTFQRTAYLYYSSQGQGGQKPGLYVSGAQYWFQIECR